MGLVLISEFSKLSLATTMMALTPVSCYYMTSFNYGGKKARDVGDDDTRGPHHTHHPLRHSLVTHPATRHSSTLSLFRYFECCY